MKLAFGCGEFKLKDCINLDSSFDVTPDIVADLRYGNFPFASTTFEVINALHVIEHIEIKYWDHLFEEFHRILIPDGKLILAYPEFEICAQNFIENKRGAREYWRATLFGRQSYPGDYHVVPMRTAEVITKLALHGFVNIKHIPEVNEEWNTFLVAHKGKPFPTIEDLLCKEVCS